MRRGERNPQPGRQQRWEGRVACAILPDGTGARVWGRAGMGQREASLNARRMVRSGPRPRACDSSYRRPLDAFAHEVEALRRRDLAPAQLAAGVSQHLAWLIREPNWLCAEYCQPGEEEYRQHLLHVADDGGWSIVSLVWKPGQHTAIHDHVAWCVVGVYEGQESETRYQLYEDGPHRFLVETATRTALPGDTTALVPPAENIHEVRNVGADLAISLHVYGANIRALGTSIHQRFDHLERRPAPGRAQVATWRTAA